MVGWILYSLGNVKLNMLIKHPVEDFVQATDIPNKEFKGNVMSKDYNLEVIVY